MSAPSALHEGRVAVLETLADLAGYTTHVNLGSHAIPDLSRIHRCDPRLFVADAKATESPSCTSTRYRLSRYAAMIKDWSRRGFEVDVALAHGPDSGRRWLACI